MSSRSRLEKTVTRRTARASSGSRSQPTRPEYQRFAWIDRKMIRVREVDNDNDPGGTVAHVGLVPGVGNGASITGHSFDARHDGGTPFYVGFRVNIPLQVSNWRMKTRAWTVDNGVIQRAYDLDGDQRNWAFRVTPYNNRQVLLTLNAGTPCGQSTSICTVESTPIKSTFVVAVPGPGTAGGVLPPGTAGEPVFDVEGESVNESDGLIDFHGSAEREPELRGKRGIRNARRYGQKRQGTTRETVEVLRFAAGETEKIVTVPIIADLTDEGSESIKGALLGATGAAIRTPEAEGWIVNSDPMPRAWITRFGRTAASHAVDAIADRLERPAGAPGRVALGGVRPGRE